MTSKPGPMLADEQGMRMLKEDVIVSVARLALVSMGYEGMNVQEVTVGRCESNSARVEGLIFFFLGRRYLPTPIDSALQFCLNCAEEILSAQSLLSLSFSNDTLPCKVLVLLYFVDIVSQR